MRLERHADAESFLAAAGELLAADEARHNLMYGICSTLISVPDAYEEAFFWTVDDEGVVAALLMTPPFNLLVARPRDGEALGFAANELRADGIELPGVGGAVPEVDEFATPWERVSGARRRVRMAQGIYAARAVRDPDEVPGTAREADARDRDLVVEWVHAFQREALHEEAPHVDLEQRVDRSLASSTAGVTLWYDGDEPVSLCGYGGQTPHGVRIGPVYTPPELRGRGYGSALTAQVTKRLLDGGRDYCFLYTDLANPTSNKIYLRIGYEHVCDALDYAFD